MDDWQARTGKVTSPGLNLRDKPRSTSVSLDQLNHGDTLLIFREEAGWLRVSVDRTKQHGWVRAAYVAIDTPPEPEPPPYVTQDSSNGYWWMLWVAGMIGLVATLAFLLR